MEQGCERRCEVDESRVADPLAGTDPRTVESHQRSYRSLLGVGAMIAVRFSLGDELAGTDTRIEIVTRCQLDVEIAADFAADAQGWPVEIRVIDRLDHGLLAVANRTKQVARFADEGRALFRRDD